MINKKQIVNSYDITKDQEEQEKKLKEQEKNNPNKPMTRHELRNVLKAMDKDGFSNILGEYINEISDPNNVKETNQFLLESEQKRDLPPNVTLAKPNIGFCIKTEKKQIGKGNQREKIFINICSLEDVPKPEETKMSDGSSWSLPYLVNKPRNDLDSKKRHCMTFDVLFNPFAIEMSRKYKPFKKFVCDNAINGINKNFLLSKNEEASQDYIIINKYDYKGNEVSLVNIHGLKAKQFDDKREEISEYKSQMMKDLDKIKEEDQYKEFDQVDITETKIQNVNRTFNNDQLSNNSNQNLNEIEDEKNKLEKNEVLKSDNLNESGNQHILTPKHIIKYIDKFDLVNYFYDPNANSKDKQSTSYSQMSIEIYLSKVNENFNISSAELEYKDKRIILSVKDLYFLNLELKSELIEETITATFDKLKKILYLKGNIKRKIVENEIISVSKLNNDEPENIDIEEINENEEVKNVKNDYKNVNTAVISNSNSIENLNEKESVVKTVRDEEKLKDVKEMMKMIKQERSKIDNQINKKENKLDNDERNLNVNSKEDLVKNSPTGNEQVKGIEAKKNVENIENVETIETISTNTEKKNIENIEDSSKIVENRNKNEQNENEEKNKMINNDEIDKNQEKDSLKNIEKNVSEDIDDTVNLNVKSSKLPKIHLIEFQNPLIYELV